MGLADFNSTYLLDSIVPWKDPRWIDYLEKNPAAFFSRVLHPAPLLICTPLIFSLLLLSAHKMGQVAILVLIALLFVLDVYQLLSFEGGDYKGCEGCFAVAIFHVLIGGVVFICSCLYTTVRYFFPSESK